MYVRPMVEHISVIWSPSLKHYIDLIEKVQRRFTKRLYGLKCLLYADRLPKLGLCSLELRRLHLDLILCYEVVFGMVNVSFNDFFSFGTLSKTRGHVYKLYITINHRLQKLHVRISLQRESYKCVELSTPCCRFFVVSMF